MNVWHFYNLYAFVISKDCIVANSFCVIEFDIIQSTKNIGVSSNI
jgi:hypothetical protein